MKAKRNQYFVEEGTVEFSNNNLTILSSTIIESSSLSKEKISKMIEESKSQLNKENLSDKTRYIIPQNRLSYLELIYKHFNFF